MNEYKYLGTIRKKTGNFKQNNIFLKRRGMRASFTLIDSLGTNIKLSSLFENVVEPILLYNCEITLAFLPINWTYSKFKDNIWIQDDQIGKVVNSFIRQILGVCKTTSTWEILTETGKYYIDENIVWNIGYSLLSISSKYVQEAHLNQDQTKKNSWCKIIYYLLTYTDMKQMFKLEAISKPKIFIEEFKCKLICKYKILLESGIKFKKKKKQN